MIKTKREMNDKWKTNPFAIAWKNKLKEKTKTKMLNDLQNKFLNCKVVDLKIADDGSGFSFTLISNNKK
jgi:hypothetical protein